MTTHAKSVFESEARYRKVQALCRAIRSDLGEHGRQAESAASIAVFLRGRDEAFWTELARQHGIRKPSAATIEAVILSFEADAEELGDAVNRAFGRLDDLAVDERWER